MNWISSQFTTRVIVLIPIAIAINIVLGYTVQTVLKLPIYLDSIGTIFVGVLAGPLAGAATGILSNLIWQYAPVIGGGTIGPFAVTAGVIGFLAGLWGYLGVFRPRPASWQPAHAAAIIAAVAGHRRHRAADQQSRSTPTPTRAASSIGQCRRRSASVIIVAAIVAAFIYCRRDLAGLWVAIAGIVTGIVAAIVSAPISAIAFGGVTGAGTDLIVAALRQGGADVLQASLGQGFFSDPIDKLITSFVVFIILVNLSPRFVARFPLGERLDATPPTPTCPATTPQPTAHSRERGGNRASAGCPTSSARPQSGLYSSLNPTTKLVVAFASALRLSSSAAGRRPSSCSC